MVYRLEGFALPMMAISIFIVFICALNTYSRAGRMRLEVMNISAPTGEYTSDLFDLNGTPLSEDAIPAAHRNFFMATGFFYQIRLAEIRDIQSAFNIFSIISVFTFALMTIIFMLESTDVVSEMART